MSYKAIAFLPADRVESAGQLARKLAPMDGFTLKEDTAQTAEVSIGHLLRYQFLGMLNSDNTVSPLSVLITKEAEGVTIRVSSRVVGINLGVPKAQRLYRATTQRIWELLGVTDQDIVERAA